MVEIARGFNGGPVKRKDIIHNQGISKDYLQNILLDLKDHKLIKAERGTNGGFRLQAPPSKVTVYDIVIALEGSLAPVECVDRASDCRKSGKCVTRKVWCKLHDAQTSVLRGVSLQDLLDLEKEDNSAIMYFI